MIRKSNSGVHLNRLFVGVCSFAILVCVSSCSSLPTVKHKSYEFPKNRAFIGVPKNLPRYEKKGLAKGRASFATLEPEGDVDSLCNNYFNKAVSNLVDRAKENGGDAVIDVKSVTFLMDGKVETYSRAECVDDGESGDVYVQGVVVKFKCDPEKDELTKPEKELCKKMGFKK